MKTQANGRLMQAGVLAIAALTACCATALAQLSPRGPVHPRYSADMPPGMIGQLQLQRGGPVRGYYQPVEIIPPEGASLAMLVNGEFQKPRVGATKVGLLIGQVYRFKVAAIPENPGFEVYPSIELIDRLYPPPGQATEHPIPVQVSVGDLEVALSGRFVTRVVYLEDPSNPFPYAEDPGRQRYFEVGAAQDPLQVADDLGRPMAILRIGSRIPDEAGGFRAAFGSPPLLQFPPSDPAAPADDADVQPEPIQPDDDPQAQILSEPTRPTVQFAPIRTLEEALRQSADLTQSSTEPPVAEPKALPAEASVPPREVETKIEQAVKEQPGPVQAQFLPIGDQGAKRDIARAEYVAPAQPTRRIPILPARLFKLPASE